MDGEIPSDTRALTCGVCHTDFSIKPPRTSRFKKVISFCQRWHKVIFPVIAVVCFLPPRVLTQCVVVLLSSMSIPWAIMSYNGLTVTLLNNNRLAVIRSGNPVPGLRAGQLLVASQRISRGSVFHHSVILLTDHSPQMGSRGIIINSVSENNAYQRLFGQNEEIGDSGQVHIGYGGPVQSNLITILHNRSNIPRSVRVAEGVYSAISVDSVFSGEQTTLRDPTMRVNILFGYAGWAPRQLDGEVSSGGWGFVDADQAIVFESPRETLWEILTAQIENQNAE